MSRLAEKERLLYSRKRHREERISHKHPSPRPRVSLSSTISTSARDSSDAILRFEIGRKVVILNRRVEKMDHDETGCQAPLEGPILCINNCGFFGSATTMNMCSKCHKDFTLKQEQAKLAASSIGSIVNGSSSSNGKEPVIAGSLDLQVDSVEPKVISVKPSVVSGMGESGEAKAKAKEGPNRCNACKKRVGLTGFNCRCGNLFCASHRYSDKHDCPFDYRSAARDAIAKANPVIKAEKLDKI